MNPKLPYELLGAIDFSLLARAILWKETAGKLIGLKRLGKLAELEASTSQFMLGIINNSYNGRSMTVMRAGWKGGRVPCVNITNWTSNWSASPSLIEPGNSRYETSGLVVSVYFTCDWIQALLDIAHERSKSLFEQYAGETDPLYPNPDPFFKDDEISMRWVIAESWPVWRRHRADWKGMYASLRSEGFPDFSIRTLQRKSKALELLKDW